MSERSYDGPPIDATEQHISERPEIEYATDPEPEGTMTATIGLPDHVEPSNESRREVLEAAADPTRSWGSCKQLQREVAPEKADGYAAMVLREEWPTRHEKIKLPDASGETVTTERITEVRERLLNGETASGVADDLGVHRTTVTNWANGNVAQEASEKSPLPPVKYDEQKQEYRTIEDAFEQLEIEINEEAAEEQFDNARKSLSEELADPTESTVEEVEAGAESIEIDDPASDDDSGVRWRVAAIAGVAAVVWWLVGGRQ